MNVSKQSYAKAILILAYVNANPDSYVVDIAEAVKSNRVSTQIILRAMADAGVVTFIEVIYGRGKRYLYTATGIELPAHNQVSTKNDVLSSNLDLVDIETYLRLPGILRALTPVAPHKAKRAFIFRGHSDSQYKQQSAIIRKDRAIALRGAVSTGVALL